MTENIMPNESIAATENNAVPISDQSIAAKMDAMRSMTLRNQMRATEGTETGETTEANVESPVAPEGVEAEPEIVEPETEEVVDGTEEYDTQETVSDDTDADSTAEELIDFIDFAETNPNAKFKFMRNGKEIVIDAKKAAAILGQGSAIHEDARQLKIQKAEFDEFLREQKTQQEGLTLAMEFTVAPQLQRAYDEILKTQNYNVTFQQQLARTQDPAEQARIMASMEQNNRYMQQQSQVIGRLKPNLDQFRELRKQQVSNLVEESRKSFTDKELKNEYVFNELKDKITKVWSNANSETLPGIKNIDLISSDEFLLGLLRDGLKFRNRPTTKQAGASVAALTSRKAMPANTKSESDSLDNLREKAKGGDKKAADNLLVAQLAKLKAARGSR